MAPDVARLSPPRPLRRPRALLVDVGFTLTSYDGARIAALARGAGVTVEAEAVEATEAAIRAELVHHSWPQRPASEAPTTGGPRFIRRVLELAGAGGEGEAALRAASEAIWQSHLEKNLWSRPLPGAAQALERLAEAGIRLVVVSNSEGTVERLLEEVGMREPFAAVLDSWHVGLAKPDPRIFALALAQVETPADKAAMVGDSLRADVEGAEGAGVTGLLLDPYDLHRQAPHLRFASLAEVADALLAMPG